VCGIIGALGTAEATPLLLDALKRLEYRGYDSAGVATLVDGRIERRRAEGKLERLTALIEGEPLAGTIGIGHTRWATHGMPTTDNAHPHASERVAVVHNGIIENFQQLRDELSGAGRAFETETDTEVVVHLLTAALDAGATPEEATWAMLARVEGAFALGILFAGRDDLLVAARRGSPLAIGYGEGEMYLGSDAMALAPLTRRICYLEEGDWAVLTRERATIRDETGAVVERAVRETALTGAAIGKGNYRHFMEKEIHEQPAVIGDTLHSYFNPLERRIVLPELPVDLAAVTRLSIVACGTSFYAGLVAKYWFEHLARLPVDIDIASEYRYRDVPPVDGTLGLFISQSGETADTLAALRHARSCGQPVLSLVNSPESTMARESDAVLHTLAGPEIGVASTKAFTTQLATLACLAIACGRARGALAEDEGSRLANALLEVPARAAEVLNHDQRLREIAEDIHNVRDVLYIGRGTSFAIALEGALKLKEVSYIHAEAYAAGELKHGPIALIDDGVPVIVIAPSDRLFDKTASNVEEVAARSGHVVLMSDAAGVARLGSRAAASVTLPAVDPLVAPILYALPVQLLAYHVAVLKGTDVDQPRNLAKSVTVE
jgi:glucosamine--fructose-6-phosphate aminotransferase (isomerizing)